LHGAGAACLEDVIGSYASLPIGDQHGTDTVPRFVRGVLPWLPRRGASRGDVEAAMADHLDALTPLRSDAVEAFARGYPTTRPVAFLWGSNHTEGAYTRAGVLAPYATFGPRPRHPPGRTMVGGCKTKETV